jgi:predicted DNA-binding protein
MQTLSFQAPEAMNQQLEALAKQLDRSKAYVIRQALESYMEEAQDLMEAKRYKAAYDPTKNVSLDEMKRRYTLD